MKLLMIRHGDPDYSIDSLTEKGWREAKLLAERMARLDVKEFYVSPLGRAKDTASCTLKKMRRTAVELEWLAEFRPQILRPDGEGRRTVSWTGCRRTGRRMKDFTAMNTGMNARFFRRRMLKEEYERVTTQFDEFLARHGYRREGHFYRVEQENNDTLVFFCHFALGCVLLSHLFAFLPCFCGIIPAQPRQALPR